MMRRSNFIPAHTDPDICDAFATAAVIVVHALNQISDEKWVRS